MSCNISTVNITENVQNKVYNLQIRLAKSTDHTRKVKKDSNLSWN